MGCRQSPRPAMTDEGPQGLGRSPGPGCWAARLGRARPAPRGFSGATQAALQPAAPPGAPASSAGPPPPGSSPGPAPRTPPALQQQDSHRPLTLARLPGPPLQPSPGPGPRSAGPCPRPGSEGGRDGGVGLPARGRGSSRKSACSTGAAEEADGAWSLGVGCSYPWGPPGQAQRRGDRPEARSPGGVAPHAMCGG